MKLPEYQSALRRRGWPYGGLSFAIVLPGVVGMLLLADRLAEASSWPRAGVFLTLLPGFLAPMLLGARVVSLVDRRCGLKCPGCGASLSFGPQVRRLSQFGGGCPRCGLPLVERDAGG